jgi:hypothetical protein
MLNIKLRAETVGAGAASRYGSGSSSTKRMRLLAAPAPQHLLESKGSSQISNLLNTKISGKNYCLVKNRFGLQKYKND